MKSTKELKYVHYLLRVRNQTTKCWHDMILETIRRRILDKVRRYDENYKPMYLDFKGEEVEIQRNTTFFKVFLKTRQLPLNPYSLKASYIICKLREALFRI